MGLKLVANNGELVVDIAEELNAWEISQWEELEVGETGKSFHKEYEPNIHGIIAIDENGVGHVSICDSFLSSLYEEEIANPNWTLLQMKCDHLATNAEICIAQL